MMLTTTTAFCSPLQLPSPSCDGCARDAGENRMWKEILVEKHIAKICSFQ